MSDQKASSDIKKLQAYVVKLEEELEDMRWVLSALLEKLRLEPGEKEELASRLVVEATELELKPAKVHYKKTIQQLLDESQQSSK
jgi:hypothetical protein